jgi:hypothetical protein
MFSHVCFSVVFPSLWKCRDRLSHLIIIELRVTKLKLSIRFDKGVQSHGDGSKDSFYSESLDLSHGH